MRRAILVVLIAALTITLPLAAGANSSSPKGAAIVVCGESSGAVLVVAASASSGLTAPAVGSDCATALVTLAGSGVKITSVVPTSNGWVYTLTSSSSSSSSHN